MRKTNYLLFCSLLVALLLLSSCNGGGGDDSGPPAGTRSLNIISAYGPTSPTAGTHYIALGEQVTVSAPDIVSGPPGTRYACNGWTGGSGDIPVIGTQNSYTFTMSMNSTITWRWQTQYQLTTNVNPSDTGTISRSPDSIWYNSGTIVELTAAASGGYRFANWSGNLSGTANPSSVTMNGARTVAASFVVQIMRDITVSSTYGVPDPPVGQNSVPDGDPYTIYCGASPVLDSTLAGTRYLCTGWTGGTGDIPATGTATFYRIDRVTQNSSITWTWQIQYRLVTAPSPVGSGTVSISPSSTDGWYAANTTVTCTAITSTGYRFLAWSSSIRSVANPLNINLLEPKSLVANFESVPFNITVTSERGVPIPPVGTTVYSGGTSVTVSCGTSPYPPDATGTRYVCTGWTGGTGNIPATGLQTSYTIVSLTQDSSITWLWTTQYQLVRVVQPVAGGWTSVTPLPETGGWYNANIVVSCNAGALGGYIWVGWSGDLTGTDRPQNLTMNGPKSITANFFIPTLTVLNPSGYDSPDPRVGDYTYAYGTQVTCSVTSPTTASTFIEGFESGTISGWTTGGNGNWFATNLEKYSGTYSARSAAIGNSQNSYIERQFVVGSGGGSLTFWWKVSSELYGDYLRFYIDGTLRSEISGTVDWAQLTFSLSQGTRTLRWQYEKNSTGVSGSDCGWIDDISVVNIPTAPANTRYLCNGYTGTGSCPSGTEGSVTFNITQNSSITWLWKTQYNVTVTVLPILPVIGGTVSPSTGWYDSGASLTLTATPSAGFTFSNWSGDLSGTTNPGTLTVDGPKSVTANFSIANARNVTVSSDRGEPNPPVGTTAYPNGYSVTLSCGTTPYSGPSGTLYVCTGWSGGSGDVPSTGTQTSYTIESISQNSAITWTWKTQYLLTAQVSPSGGGSVILTPTSVDNWYDAGTIVSCDATEAAGYGWSGWSDALSGTTKPQNLTMDAPKSITANFFKPTLTVATNPTGADLPNPAAGTHTPDYDSSVTCSVSSTAFNPVTDSFVEGFESGAISGKWTTGGNSPWFITSTERYSGTYSARSGIIPVNQSGTNYIQATFAIPRDGTVTFWWKTDSLRDGLVFRIDGSWSASVSGATNWQQRSFALSAGTRTLRWEYSGSNWGYGYQECGWVDDITITCPGANYVCTGYTGTGSCPASGSDTSVTFTITQNSSITWNWKLVYKLTVNISPTGSGTVAFDPPSTNNYFDANSTATLTANPNTGQNFSFAFWEGDLTGTTNPQSLNMNSPKTVTANFRSLPYTVTVASAYGAPNPPVGANNYLGGDRVTVSCGTTPYSGPTGTRYVSRGWAGGFGDIPLTGTGTSYTFTVTQNSTITWVWQIQYQLTSSVSPAGGGTVTPSSGGWYDAGTVVVCNAIANSGYGWLEWSGDLTGTDRPKNLAMSSPKSITANFVRPTLTVYNPQGYGSPNPPVGTASYNYGTSVTCSVTSPAYVPTPPTVLSEGFDAGNIGDWITGGNANWTAASDEKYAGSYSARSGAITDSQATYIQKSINLGTRGGTLTFWWKVSSESNFDFLRFDIDGVEQAAISGETAWAQSPRYLLAPGRRTLRWRYTKDVSDSAGRDRGWIDSILIVSTPGTQYLCTGYIGTGSCPSTGSESSVTFAITQNSSITWLWRTQYRLMTGINPLESGAINISPFTSDYYDADTYLTLTATANYGYGFGLWSGDLTGFTNPQSLTMDAPKTVTANFIGPNKPANFAGTASSSSAITWTWSGTSDWRAAAAGALRSVAETLTAFQTTYGDVPPTEPCPRDGSGSTRQLFEAADDLPASGTQDCPTIDVLAAYTYTITYTRLSSTQWTCTADTHLAGSNNYDYYIDQTGILREARSTGDGAQAGASSDTSPDNVWFEIRDSYETVVGRIYPNISSWQETALSENIQYTRHVHAMNYGLYSEPSNDASVYTLVHNATTTDFSLTLLSGTSRGTVTRTTQNQKRYPIDSSANYARCQMLYLIEELGTQPKTIAKIGFQRYAGDPLGLSDQVNNIEIKMGLTTQNALADGPSSPSRWIDTSAHFLVYNGNLTVPPGSADSWFEIPLTETFYYDGVRHVVVTISHQDGSKEDNFTTWKNHQVWGYGGYLSYIKCLVGFSDTVVLPSVSPVQDRPNIRFEYAGSVRIDIIPPPNSTTDYTGVRIERDTSSTFTAPIRVQDFGTVYTRTDSVASGTWYYRIRFRNGDGVASAYSSGTPITVPSPP